MSMRIAYKLLHVRKDQSLGPLFINRTQRIPQFQTLEAEAHLTKGYAFRPGWHCTAQPAAPHLSMKDRVWFRVIIEDFEEHVRPASQGGLWFTAKRMSVQERCK